MDEEKIPVMILENIYASLMTDDWQKNTRNKIENYKKMLEILNMLELCIDRDELFLSKTLIQDELDKIAGTIALEYKSI